MQKKMIVFLILSTVLVGCNYTKVYVVNQTEIVRVKANQNITAITFQYEILKTKLLDYKQQNWNAIQSTNYKRDVVDVSSEIVKIPTNVQLGFVPSLHVSN